MSAADFDLSKIPSSVLDIIPAGAPPKGVKSNLDNPVSRDAESKVVIWVLLPVMMVFLLLRLYTRVRIQRTWGADDSLAVASALCIGGYCGILIYMVDGPGGEHIWDTPISHVTEAIMKCNLASQCVFALASIFIKSTLLVLYLRIFRPSNRATIMIWAGIVFVVIFHVAGAIAVTIILHPRKGHTWFDGKGNTVATNATRMVAAQGVISVVTDLYCLLIPMQLVVGLHLPRGRKFGVAAIFLTGLIACVCSIVGTVYRFRLRGTRDMFWDSVLVYELTVIELNIGIICACLPVFPVLLKNVAKSESYVSLVHRFRTRTRSRESTEEKDSQSEISDPGAKIQVQVPKPTMTGLMSFIRGSRGLGSVMRSGRVDSFLGVDSVNDDDYHGHLRASV